MKQTFTKRILLITYLVSAVLIWSSCNKNNNDGSTLPILVTTDVVTDATGTVGQAGGIVTQLPNGVVRLYGVCYSPTNQTPTITDSTSVDTVSQPGFICKLKNLKPKTTYYLRSFAINPAGTGYGNVVQFTTGDPTSVPAGTVSTLAGSSSYGFADGNGSGALFDNPQGITAGADGNLYIADSFNSAIRKVTTGGQVTTISGNGSIGYIDGTVASAQFYAPQALITDAAGNIYVSDLGNNVIRKITPDGTVSTLAGSGYAGYIDGTGTAAEFRNPRGLAIDAAGNIYVADGGNNLIRKVTPAGVVTTVAGNRTAGFLDGPDPTGVEFNSPGSLAIDASGNIYVADVLNTAIRKITPAGLVSTLTGGPAQYTIANWLGSPKAIAFDAKGNMLIADENGRILEITPNKVLYAIAGNTGVSAFADGTGTAASFYSPEGLSIDAGGNIWVADCFNNRIRKVTVQ